MKLVVDTFPSIKACRVMEFILTCNCSSVLPYFHKIFPGGTVTFPAPPPRPSSITVEFNSAYVSQFLELLTTEPFHGAPVSVQLMSQETPGFAHHFLFFWTSKKVFCPQLFRISQGLLVLLLHDCSCREVLPFSSIKWLNSAFKDAEKLLSLFHVSFRGCLRMG